MRRLAHPELIETDIREERFVAHTLQLAIQAALDASSHIISDLRLGEPETNRQLFGLLRGELALSEELSGNLQKMAGFRDLLVHGYQSIDRRILRHVVEHNTDDLLAFAQAVRSRLLQ